MLEVDPRAAQQRPEKNTYAVATANVLGLNTISALLWGMDKHVEVAQQAGYKVEVWPQRMRGRRFRAERMSDMAANGTASGHQAFPIPKPEAKFPRKLQIRAVLPESEASLHDMTALRNRVGHDIPIVLFENASLQYLVESGFTETGIQTHPELCADWQVRSAQGFVDKMREKGFSNVVIDTHHLRRPNTETGEVHPLGKWQTSLPVLLEHSNEIHIGVGRTETVNLLPEPQRTALTRQIRSEVTDLLNGGENNTEIIQMLKMIADAKWKGLVVLELNPSELPDKNFLGQVSKRTLIKAYKDIGKTLKKFLGN